ncbi:DUF3667 domain-containing protein [uncultured Sphingomonas sp.]|uniref:DUF3667 domain-containing protein n=1 Tax=uncultured Sphingomonas sp. TaxID=158754 RepID=UPI00262D7834|nr:DUF3667 domain-containing protein [uncultured Sphingomonas sp.]
MTGIEAGADIATGALLARAVEPVGAVDSATGGHGAGECLNCGTGLIGAHCHGCGQAGHVHRTISAIGHEIAHGVFHFDGKIWRTLPLLVLHPGELTRRYIAGERARFVSPLAVFLFSVFLMFAVVANLSGWHLSNPDFLKPGVNGGMAQARLKLDEERLRAVAAANGARAKLAKEQRKSDPDNERVARFQQRIAKADEAVRAITTAERALPLPTTFDVEGAPRSSDSNWLEAKFRHMRENPELVLYKLKNTAYKYSWALIPISLPFLWLLFPFSRRYGMYDHAVFTTYSLTFMTLLTIALALLGAIGVPGWQLWAAAAIISPIHIYKQLKGTYRLSRTSGLIRTMLLCAMILCAIVPIFAVLLIVLGLA